MLARLEHSRKPQVQLARFRVVQLISASAVARAEMPLAEAAIRVCCQSFHAGFRAVALSRLTGAATRSSSLTLERILPQFVSSLRFWISRSPRSRLKHES